MDDNTTIKGAYICDQIKVNVKQDHCHCQRWVKEINKQLRMCCDKCPPITTSYYANDWMLIKRTFHWLLPHLITLRLEYFMYYNYTVTLANQIKPKRRQHKAFHTVFLEFNESLEFHVEVSLKTNITHSFAFLEFRMKIIKSFH